MKSAITITLLIICSQFSLGGEVPERLIKLISDPNAKLYVDADYKKYNENYVKTVTGEAERRDREAAWKKLSDYASSMWEVMATMKPGDPLSDYPGLLTHGRISWDAKNRTYFIVLGLAPFGYDDGLGTYKVFFDQNWKILKTQKSYYSW